MSIQSKNFRKFTMKNSVNLTKGVFAICCLMIIASYTASAQNNIKVIEFSHLSSENNSKQLQFTSIDSKKIKSLIVDLHPSVYLENGEINFYSQKPTTAFLDLRALATTINRDVKFESVEFVSIRIDQQNAISGIDLSKLNVFPNLKYIYFACFADCNESQIQNRVSDLNKDYIIIYRLENKS